MSNVLEVENHLIIDIEGFEGPIDLLLSLARSQKVDLKEISVFELAQQYINYINSQTALKIDIAADYLVMAAWLAFLKSKILLPEEEDEQLSGEELSDALKIQLSRLQSMREAGNKLFELDLLYIDRFPKGIISKEIKNPSLITFTFFLPSNLFLSNISKSV